MNAHSISLFVLLKLILTLCLDAQSRIVTLEGELINGNIKSISDKGVVSLDEKEIYVNPTGNFVITHKVWSEKEEMEVNAPAGKTLNEIKKLFTP